MGCSSPIERGCDQWWISRDRRDRVVASFMQRLGIPMYTLFPSKTETIIRLGCGDDVTKQVAEAHRPEAMGVLR